MYSRVRIKARGILGLGLGGLDLKPQKIEHIFELS